jgi:hypothetical protein
MEARETGRFLGAWNSEGVGFEPTDPFGSPVFKTGAINRSTIPPFPGKICLFAVVFSWQSLAIFILLPVIAHFFGNMQNLRVWERGHWHIALHRQAGVQGLH